MREGLKAWLYPHRVRPGVDLEFWQWVSRSPQGFARVIGNFGAMSDPDRQTALERLEWPQRVQILLNCRVAAEKTLPEFANINGPRTFSCHSMMALYCLMLFKDCSYRGILAHLKHNFPERILTLGRLRTIPGPTTLLRFEASITPDTWQTFLSHLKPMNSGLACILQHRRECKSA